MRGWLRMRASTREVSGVRLCSFLAGVALLWLALASPLASYVHQFLTAHMIQHLLLMTISPALVLLADPLKVFQLAMPPQLARSTRDFFRIPPLPQFGKLISNPIVCWLASTAVLLGWHIPAIFARSFASPPLHQFEQFTFLFAGFLFWWAVVQPWPSAYTWPRWLLLLYLFLATLPCDILSAYLTFCDRVVYAPYLDLRPNFANAVLRDQEFAGSLMWTCITIFYLVPAAVLTVQLLGSSAENMDRAVSEPSHVSSRTRV